LHEHKFQYSLLAPQHLALALASLKRKAIFVRFHEREKVYLNRIKRAARRNRECKKKKDFQYFWDDLVIELMAGEEG
jgi:hypothetical protein